MVGIHYTMDNTNSYNPDTGTWNFIESGIYVDLDAGTASGEEIGNDIISNIERVKGTAGNDILLGTNNTDAFDGFLGDDYIDGRDGFDFITYNDSLSPINIDLNAGTVTSVEGNDTIHSIEMFFATKFDDVIYGDDNDTWFKPDPLADFYSVYNGNGGSDFIDAGEGFDTVWYIDNDVTSDDLYSGIVANLKKELLLTQQVILTHF